MKKAFFLVAIGIIATTQLYSTDISFSGTFDTYGGKPGGGVSFAISGNIFESLEQVVTIEYNYNNSYTSTTASIYKGAFWSAGGGFALILNTNSVYPGLYVEASISAKKVFSIKAEFIFGGAAENIFKPAIYDVKLITLLDLPNANTLISIGYQNELLESTKILAGIEVIAYGENFPLQIAINSNAEFILSSASQNDFELALDVGGALHFFTKKAGTYFVGFSVQAISLNSEGTPFSVNVGTKFSL